MNSLSLIETNWELLSIFIATGFGILVSIALAAKFGLSNKRAIIIYLWHTIFCLAYLEYMVRFGSDSIGYYSRSLSESPDLAPGTQAITFITAFFSKKLDFGIFSTTLIFSVFGVIGLIALDGSLKNIVVTASTTIKRFASYLIFLPSISFWSSGISKDGLAFMAAALMVWSISKNQVRLIPAFLAVFVMFWVRPHIAGVMVLAFLVSLVISRKIRFMQRVVLGMTVVAAVAIIVPFALEYGGIDEDTTLSDFEELLEHRQSQYAGVGSGIDLSTMSFPMQIVTYLFRPLPFEAHNISSFAASIDNVIFLLIFLFGSAAVVKNYRILKDFKMKLMLLYFSGGLLILATHSGNLGIAVRQKWMILPAIFFLFLNAMSQRYSRQYRTMNFQRLRRRILRFRSDVY